LRAYIVPQRVDITSADPRAGRVSSAELATLGIVSVTILAVTALIVILLIAAGRIDSGAARHEEQLVANGLKLKDAALRNCIVPQTVWDETVTRLDHRYDPEWAATNIGQYLTTTCGAAQVFALGAEGKVLGAWTGGVTQPAQAPNYLEAGINDLIRSIRTREAARGVFPNRPAQAEMIAKPIDETNVVLTPAGPVVISASLVQPDFGSVLPRGARSPVVVTVQPIDAVFLDWLRSYFLIRSPHADVWPFESTSAEFAKVEMSDRAGRPLVRFSWRYDQPVRDLAWIIGPSIGLLVLILLAAAAATIWKDRRQAHRLNVARLAAHAASEAKSRFIANMSHEIRTPMNGVLGVLHILRGGDLDPDSRRMVEEAMASGVLLQGLLNDVLDLSRIEEGRLELDPHPLDPAAALREVVALFDAQAAKKGVSLRATLTGAPVQVIGDGLRLRQVMLNLVSNAVKFSSRGEIAVGLTLTLGRDTEACRLHFEVIDQGVGIPRKVQHAIFGRFTQADGSVSRRFGGSGLGLSICQALVDLMGGEIGFTSAEGEGSTFWFEMVLPLAAVEPMVEAPEAEDADIRLEGVRALIVEDNATNRLVATRLLEALGLAVETACDGAEGLEAARLGTFDLILMDIQMPVMDGISATRAIRSLDGPPGQVPILGLTANVLASQKRSYLEAGMDDVVDKPINPGVLFERIALTLKAARSGEGGRNRDAA
jgi:signal transduction histidine kinase/ActR/RegA family two-component response regulator